METILWKNIRKFEEWKMFEKLIEWIENANPSLNKALSKEYYNINQAQEFISKNLDNFKSNRFKSTK